jgi:integrase
VAGVTVRREIAILSHALRVAMHEWAVALPHNPVSAVKLPRPSAARTRRIEGDELTALIASCRAKGDKRLEAFINLAVETGMRRSELLRLEWRHVNLKNRTLHIPLAKNGHARTIPLSSRAIDVLSALPHNEESVFGTSANAVRLAWERLRRRVGIEGLRMHDLRHEAVSRFFERGLSIAEVAVISGHRDVRQLFRYTHLRPSDIAQKLDSR